MITLAKFSISKPKIALLIWVVIAGGLSAIGLGVDHSIAPTVTVIRGTDSYRAQQLAEQKFGPNQLIPILLEGPKAQLNRSGPTLVRALSKRPYTRVLSAWDTGTASAGLRPRPNAALLVVSVARPEKDVVKYDQPAIQKLVKRQIASPVRSYISGQASIDTALKDQSISALKEYAAIAFGVLFVMLLIGLRAPLAAGLVTVVAGTVTLSAFGVMALLGKVLEVDALAMATGALAGLARGASFSLVMLDRFHHDEEAHPQRTLRSMLTRDVGSTGRALLYGGTIMLGAMLLADMFGPTAVLAPLGIGAFICTALATGAAVIVVPAALALAGPVINDWRIPAPGVVSRGWNRMVGFGGAIIRHPLPTGALATVALLALAVPAAAIKTGPMDIRQLPPNDKARVAFNEISRVMGPGYVTPYDVIVANPKGPITSAATLAQLTRFEKRIAKDRAVSSVTGPGRSFGPSANQLKSFGPSLAHSAKISEQSKRNLLKLINGLGLAGSGSKQLQNGLAAAASGAGLIHGGSGQAQAGAGTISYYLGQVLAGADKLVAGLAQAHAGAGESVNGLQSLSSSTASTKANIANAKSYAQVASSDVSAALAALTSMTKGKQDRRYAAVGIALTKASSAISSMNNEVANAIQSAAATNNLAALIAHRAPALVSGLQLLLNGESQLKAGVAQLRTGAIALESGLGQLTSGSGQLASGLAGGVGPAGQLVGGLGTMQAGVIKARGQIPSTAALRKLQREAPGMFNSGYFVLAAIAGATPSNRNAANFALNVGRGGNAGQMIVVSRYPVSDKRSEQLGVRLRGLASDFARTSHLQVALGGPAGSLFDIARTANSKLPAVLIAMALGVALMLGVMLRSVAIPVVATLTAALTTAAGFGVMQLLFGGNNPPLGGPGTFDGVTLTEVGAGMFGASLLYIAVLLARTREYFVASGDARVSLQRGMRGTIAATSGIAAVTVGILVTFAFTELVPVRRVSVAAAVAVAIMAYVILPVLLPAAMSLLGRFGWWPSHGPEAVAVTVPGPAPARRRLPRLHLPHRAGPAH